MKGDAQDTASEVRALVVDHWRSSTLSERAEMTGALCRDVDLLARTQIRLEQPDIDEAGLCKELTRRRFGPALANAAFGERVTRV